MIDINNPIWAADPKGTKSCRTQGEFLYIRLSIRPSNFHFLFWNVWEVARAAALMGSMICVLLVPRGKYLLKTSGLNFFNVSLNVPRVCDCLIVPIQVLPSLLYYTFSWNGWIKHLIASHPGLGSSHRGLRNSHPGLGNSHPGLGNPSCPVPSLRASNPGFGAPKPGLKPILALEHSILASEPSILTLEPPILA